MLRRKYSQIQKKVAARELSKDVNQWPNKDFGEYKAEKVHKASELTASGEEKEREGKKRKEESKTLTATVKKIKEEEDALGLALKTMNVTEYAKLFSELANEKRKAIPYSSNNKKSILEKA